MQQTKEKIMSSKTVISFVVAILILAISLTAYKQLIFAEAELYLYDVQAKLFRANKKADPNIKIILVDEAALKAMSDKLGRWPWPRAIWGDVLEYLTMGGARAVLFDILFIEQDLSNKLNDKVLQSATQESKIAYHSMLIRHEETEGHSPENGPALPADFIDRFSLKNISPDSIVQASSSYNDYVLPINRLSEASKGVAVVEFGPDLDGVFRRSIPLREYQGSYFPVLGLAPFIDRGTPVKIGKNTIQINDRTIPLDENGNSLINMYDIDQIETYSLSGVFKTLQQIRKGDDANLFLSPEIFKDSIVYLGASAIGAADLKAIPISPSAPGVLLHAFQASNYLQHDFMSPPNKKLSYLSMFIGVFLTSWAILFSKRLLIRVMLPLSMLVIYIGYAIASFKSNVQIELVPFIFSSAATGFFSFAYLTFTEGADKNRVSKLFAQYVSKEVLDEMMSNSEEHLKSNAGQRVELTVLFSDIRGFTTMSENSDPEKIVEMLNIHFTVMAEIILKHNGTIDKYIGDAIMAFWGAPLKTKDHAEQAVLAGIEMIEGLKEVNRILQERGCKHDIQIGIGINTGVATIGNIGSAKKMNYTIVGDTVNLSSRLESITKEYKTPLLFSEYTYNQIKHKIPCKLIGNVTVKGREQSVDIYTYNQTGANE
jgi:adenylate cyclase